MNKQSTRAFAAGIFLSAIILAIYSFFMKNHEDPESLLEAQGYVILTQEEAKERSQEVNDLQDQVDTLSSSLHAEDKEEKQNSGDTKNLTKMTLTVSPGMTPKEISNELEKNGIIRNSSDLNSYLINSGLADKIQIGEYMLDSEMTLEEISTLLTE
ncbi:hypothetical protein D3H55_15685 [Bacillus salacetis]|uniref:Endolytic transglycosylase MltG n=1 Tax=Bacillus salacetis TaxID=2315464 RepID=A0A3A1QWD8_9BACI|nr:endolytic transglycosylase MltG [Bacillus salacetis]RIW31049.1 hypothetical protein D3H55_15685 [Bacillus salacetis]